METPCGPALVLILALTSARARGEDGDFDLADALDPDPTSPPSGGLYPKLPPDPAPFDPHSGGGSVYPPPRPRPQPQPRPPPQPQPQPGEHGRPWRGGACKSMQMRSVKWRLQQLWRPRGLTRRSHHLARQRPRQHSRQHRLPHRLGCSGGPGGRRRQLLPVCTQGRGLPAGAGVGARMTPDDAGSGQST